MLRRLKVGVQMVGNDGCNTPPAHALADRGVIDNVVGYTVYGDYAEENPPARIVEGVAKREVDVTVVSSSPRSRSSCSAASWPC